ncbi:ABC transporter permease [Paenibacillus tarimensis]|uniref:ABC transporter permease n=1 Tax=Paenibacillus tarimensis TaxID=416012 RepID=UPI001F2AA4FD|nr:ABC-2 family transporter protein [Paenibacillus tarimensis]MCF2945154.1 ABC-2 family transporter protein [Paenibacillus tarimensis]
MDSLYGLARLYFWNMKISLQKMMVYRFDFIASLLVSILVSGIGPYVQYLYFTRSNGYPGWTLNEMFLFQGLLLLWLGLRDLLFGDIRGYVIKFIRSGDFDKLLIKPYSPVGVILVSGFSLSGIGPCSAGMVVLLVAWSQLNLTLCWETVVLLIVMFISGLLLYLAIIIMFSAITIMLVQMNGIGLIIDRLLGFADYPVDIFPKAVQTVLLTALPFAVWTFYPTQILLGRSDIGMWVASASSLIVLWISLQCWKRCLHHYTSAGG